MTGGRRTSKEAQHLYNIHIIQTGFSPPASYEELLLFVDLSGAIVAYHVDAPDDFGLQFGEWIIVTGSDRITDRDRMKILAHEWCHWLRRSCAKQMCFRFYDLTEEVEERDWEEQVARAFARLF